MMVPEHSYSRRIADIALGAVTWVVDSDCGVVKVRDWRGCMVALNATQARRLAPVFSAALLEAADSVERAQAGGKR
jgi:hypothetical protein